MQGLFPVRDAWLHGQKCVARIEGEMLYSGRSRKAGPVEFDGEPQRCLKTPSAASPPRDLSRHVTSCSTLWAASVGRSCVALDEGEFYTGENRAGRVYCV